MNLPRLRLFALLLLPGLALDAGAAAPDLCENGTFNRAAFQRQLRQYLASHYPEGEEASAMAALGAWSGLAVQEGIRQQLVLVQRQPEARIFAVDRVNGETYFSGRFLDQRLLSEDPRGRASVWSVLREGAVQAGAGSLPEVAPLVQKSLERMGTPMFGLPDPLPDHPVAERPAEALQKHWPTVRGLLTARKSEPLAWGCEIALAAREFMLQRQAVLPPATAVTLFMEAAVPMSRVDATRLLKP